MNYTRDACCGEVWLGRVATGAQGLGRLPLRAMLKKRQDGTPAQLRSPVKKERHNWLERGIRVALKSRRMPALVGEEVE
jgi:hypothetical protein